MMRKSQKRNNQHNPLDCQCGVICSVVSKAERRIAIRPNGMIIDFC